MPSREQSRGHYEPSAGVVAGTAGVAVVLLGALCLVNANEGSMFAVLGIVLGASGVYLLVAGAVARGIQLAAWQSAASRADRERDSPV